MNGRFECYSDLEHHFLKELTDFESIEWSVRNAYEQSLESQIQSGTEQQQVLSNQIEQLEREISELRSVQNSSLSSSQPSECGSYRDQEQWINEKGKLLEELKSMQLMHKADQQALIALGERTRGRNGDRQNAIPMSDQSAETSQNTLLISHIRSVADRLRESETM